MKKINLLFKRILPCLLIIITLFALASCKGCKKDNTSTYPSVTPSVTDPNGAYLTVGDYKVTNKTVYNRLLLTYGLETLKDMIAKDYLAGETYDPHYSNEDFEEKLDEIIYGDLTDETEKAEAFEAFKQDMRAIGLFTEEEYKAYYKLTYDKMNYVVKVFKNYVAEYNKDEANEEDYFTEEQYKEYHESTNLPKVSAIVITFDSQYQALKTMEAYKVNINKLTGNWEIDGQPATVETITKVFTSIYEEINGSADAVKEYEAADLSKISSTIQTKVYDLEVLSDETISKSYTHAPAVYGTRYYLALKTAENKEGIKEYEDLTEEEKDDIFHALVENSISDSNITKILGETFADLKIYDEGLEIRYIEELKAAYEELGSEDEIPYTATTDEESSVIARYTVKGEEKTITAQALFDEMLKQYGAALTFSLLQQYSVLSNSKYNSVYNILNGQVLDQEKYDSYYKTDVRQYKTSFEAGNYASKGFPASYGWENFLRDYLGVNKEEDLMISLDSSLFKAAQDIIAKDIWLTVTEEKDDNGETVTKYDDTLIQNEMENIYNKFYNASVVGLYTFYDKDNDGVGDLYLQDTDSDSVSDELLQAAYKEAEAIYLRDAYLNKTFEQSLTEVVNQYNLASSTNVSSKWYEYKSAGLRLFVISTVTYTSSSSINEKLSSKIKTLWDAVRDYKVDEKEVDIFGKSLDPVYRFTTTDDEKVVHAHSVSPLDFTTPVFYTNNANDDEITCNIAYKISLTKATNASYIGTASSKIYKPQYSDYASYIKDSTSVTSSMKTAITTYYIPAINNILKIDGVSNAKTLNIILDMVKELVNTANVSVNNAEVKARVEQLIQDTYTETPVDGE